MVEIPTVDETFDNIVAFWNPSEKPKAGQELLFSYRLHWGTRMPYGSPLAQTLATRTGIGGTVGVKRSYYSWHFAVDFAGGELGAVAKDAPVGLTEIRLAFDIDSPATREQIDKLIQLTERYCVIYQTLKNPPPVYSSRSA